jgi:hypothetical protein
MSPRHPYLVELVMMFVVLPAEMLIRGEKYM